MDIVNYLIFSEYIAPILVWGVFTIGYIVWRLIGKHKASSKEKHKKYRLYVYNPSFTECKYTKPFNSKKDLLEYVLSQEYSNIQLFSFREEE